MLNIFFLANQTGRCRMKKKKTYWIIDWCNVENCKVAYTLTEARKFAKELYEDSSRVIIFQYIEEKS